MLKTLYPIKLYAGAGAVDWGAHIPRLLTKCLWAFQVPVGTASAVPPFGEQTSDAAQGLQALLLAAFDESTGNPASHPPLETKCCA